MVTTEVRVAFEKVLTDTLNQLETLDNGDIDGYKRIIIDGIERIPKAQKMKCAFLACCAVVRVDEFLEGGQMCDSDKTINEFEAKGSSERTALRQDAYNGCIERMLVRLKIKHRYLPRDIVDFEVSDPAFNCGIEVCASLGSKSEIKRNLEKFERDPYSSQMILHGLTLSKSGDHLRPDGFISLIKDQNFQVDLVEFRHSTDFREKSFFISFFDEKDPSIIKVKAQPKIPVFALFNELMKDFKILKEQSKNITGILKQKDDICNEEIRIIEAKHRILLDAVKNDTRKLELLYQLEIMALQTKLDGTRVYAPPVQKMPPKTPGREPPQVSRRDFEPEVFEDRPRVDVRPPRMDDRPRMEEKRRSSPDRSSRRSGEFSRSSSPPRGVDDRKRSLPNGDTRDRKFAK